MSWDVDGYVATLTAVSPHTLEAYERDLRQFVEWADRGGCAGPTALDHITLRRYLGYLNTRGFSRRTIARKAAALRSYLRYLRRHGVLATDPGRTLRAPKGPSRLPRVPRSDEAVDLIDLAGEAADEASESDDEIIAGRAGGAPPGSRGPRGALRHRRARLRALRARPRRR